MHKILFSFFLLVISTSDLLASEFDKPWLDTENAIVLDPFGGNAIDFDALARDHRVVGIIHKASQGLKADSGYSARRTVALSRKYLWGSYHLLTTANVAQQIDGYLAIVGKSPSETHAIDVECLQGDTNCKSADLKVSISSVEQAMRLFKERTGKYPVLYVNNNVAQKIGRAWAHKSEFSDARLWYARYIGSIKSTFPIGPWRTYALWQFSSEINCDKSKCQYRVPGTAPDMDVNVYFGSPDKLRASWPLDR